jgi:DNA-binding CsgD family transcriptional regulator
MPLFPRLLRAFGYDPSPRLTFHAELGLIQSLEALAAREGRQAGEVAQELLAAALDRRQAEEGRSTCWDGLSPREQQTAALICLDCTNRQIAAGLGISPTTAKSYVRNVLRKFGLKSKAELRRELAGWDFSAWSP